MTPKQKSNQLHNLADRILDFLKDNPGQKASVIANELNAEKKEVNTVLYDRLDGKCVQDQRYRWYLSKDKKSIKDITDGKPTETVLSDLCNYYMACMSRSDETDVSVFASNKYNDLDYVELDHLPIDSNEDLFYQTGVQKIIGKMRKDRNRLTMYFGYPATLKKTKSKKSDWVGFFVEPIFLIPVEKNGNNLVLGSGAPMINSAVIKRFSNAEREQVMGEIVQLEQELGLIDDGEIPDLDELVQRLSKIRNEWPWAEKIDPHELSKDSSLDEICEEGIYNRGVLMITERSPFTEGLETELKELTQLKESQYKNTILGKWLSEKMPNIESKNNKTLLEVLPLNFEQRQAVSHSLNNALTVITGPPGTGKSQVVTDLIINAAWQGKKVLFASKNNKAVDVVETRINNLSPQPILIRMGSSHYQSKLAEYLLCLMNSNATKDDEDILSKNISIYEKYGKKLLELDGKEEELITARNLVDQLDQIIDNARSELSSKTYEALKTIDANKIEDRFLALKNALNGVIKERQSIFIKIIWPIIKTKRYKRLSIVLNKMKKHLTTFDISFPNKKLTNVSIDNLKNLSKKIDNFLNLSSNIQKYYTSLAILQKTRSLEDINIEKIKIITKLANGAKNLWKSWLKLRPMHLKASDRVALNSYKTLLKMVIESGSDLYNTLGSKYYFEYKNLAHKVAHLLPAWAVTSLSARGKIPLEAGFFDLVIFDESSQCDIASALPLLYRAKNAVIIGDPKQLTHISTLKKGEDRQLLEKYNLIKYAHWAYSYNSLYDLASGFVSGGDVVNLRDHHRSHADIINFSDSFFYGESLRVATNYDKLKLPSKKEAGIRWVNVVGSVKKPSGGGAENLIEAKVIIKELKRLVINQDYKGTIGVVTPFRAQANAIRQLVNKDESLANKLINNEFLVDTVHKFQGDERDIMIFSPVLSESMPSGGLVFLKNNGNLFNVAITRARSLLLVVGDKTASLKCDVNYLAKFAQYVQKKENGDFEKQIDINQTFGPKYPAVTRPETVSEWEHMFYEKIYKAGIRPIPQYQVEKYTLDFALFDGERKLNIEIDGEYYHRNWTGELCRRDQIRNQRMLELGWDVMRFWVYEVRDDMAGCIKKIQKWLKANANK